MYTYDEYTKIHSWQKVLPRHHAVGLNSMLKAVELPARIADLNPRLTDVDADDLPHDLRNRAEIVRDKDQRESKKALLQSLPTARRKYQGRERERERGEIFWLFNQPFKG